MQGNYNELVQSNKDFIGISFVGQFESNAKKGRGHEKSFGNI